MSETARLARLAVDSSRRAVFGDATAPVESDPNAMKMINNAADEDDDNAPATSPNSNAPRTTLDSACR